MSLIVQVSGGGTVQSNPQQKGGGQHTITRPPPAHVTQLTSSPALGTGVHQATHVVQHHPQPAPHPVQVVRDNSQSYPPRALPISPHRVAHQLARHRNTSGRLMINSSVTPMNHLPTPPMPHLPNSPLPLLTPSPAHQLLPASVNSPSLIPQNIPSGFMPRLPICLPSSSRGVPLPTAPRPSLQTPRSPLMAQQDSNILHPHAFKKLTRPMSSQPDDDIDMGDRPVGPQHHHVLTGQIHHSHLPQQVLLSSHQLNRRAIMSPRQRERRGYFNNLALQDHNYCAAPPPSPPRSPTPPPSPFLQQPPQVGVGGMGVQPPSHQAPVGSNMEEQDQPLSVGGLPGYNPSSSVPPVSAPSSAGCLGNYPSPHYTGPPLSAPQVSSPLSRLRQTIEDAGVGPMTPLEEATSEGDRSRDSESREKMTVREEDGGEETETAPEAEDDNQDDSITRCICDYLHDDGYMICCDKCFVWQHVVCMGLDRNNIPEEYLCEKCSPRVGLDRKRAKALQRAREKEIYAKMLLEKAKVDADSSDDDKPSIKTSGSSSNIMQKSKKVITSVARKFGKKTQDGKKSEKKNLKKSKRRGGSGGLNKTSDSSKGGGESPPKEIPPPNKKASPRKNIRRKSMSASDADTDEENSNDSTSLRSWIDNYEEAVTNHYSPELRARLQGAKLPANYFKPKEVNGLRERCNVNLRGNGLKVLTANSFIPPNTPIIECRGKYMMPAQMVGGKRTTSIPFILLHTLSSDLDVVVDGKTYGNDSRFCRRADPKSGIESNAVVKHHLEKGSLHLYIVASKNIEKNQEILLPPVEKSDAVKNGVGVGGGPGLSIQEELQQMRRREVANQEAARGLNGVQDSKNQEPTSRRKTVGSNSLKRRIKRENAKKKEREIDSSSDEEVRGSHRESRFPRAAQTVHPEPDKDKPPSPRKTRSAGDKLVPLLPDKEDDLDGEEEHEEENIEQILEKVEDINEEFEEDEDEDEKKIDIIQPIEITPIEEEFEKEKVCFKPEEKLEIIIPKEEIKEEDTDLNLKSPLCSALSPDSQNNLQKSPGKASLGLPDQSGLIVGVNTINYDVSIRNKAKTREEKKMEMIMKAIEQMERAEARKKTDGADSSSEKPEKKRRRSNSVKTGRVDQSADSNLDASSADESSAPVKLRTSAGGGTSKGRGRRQTGGSLTTRRRSRAKSGDSSALSENEGCDGAESLLKNPEDLEPQEFKFPRHKRHTGVLPESGDIDDDVSRQYLRGSRSPPGIANHLLRSSSRVLRAQQSNSSTEGERTSSESIPTTPAPPVVTQISQPEQSTMKTIGCSAKKRWLRAAMEDDIQEEQGSASPTMQVSPEPDYTPLKKRRLATYNESEEQLKIDTGKEVYDVQNLPTPVNEKLKSLPNGLKKRLISNLVLEAVLDRAMEDYNNTPSVDNYQKLKDNVAKDLTEKINVIQVPNNHDISYQANTKSNSLIDEKSSGRAIGEGNIYEDNEILECAKEDAKDEMERADQTEEDSSKVSDKEDLEDPEELMEVDQEVLQKIDEADNLSFDTNLSPSLSPPESPNEMLSQVTVPPSEDLTSPNEFIPSPHPVSSPLQVTLNSSLKTGSSSPFNEGLSSHMAVGHVETGPSTPPDNGQISSLEIEQVSPEDNGPSSPQDNGDISPMDSGLSPLMGVGPSTPKDNGQVSPGDNGHSSELQPSLVQSSDKSPPHYETSPLQEPSPPVLFKSSFQPELPALIQPYSAQLRPLSPPITAILAPVPSQHSVFKSFFSTDLSVEEIDRQLETKRVQLARETAAETRELCLSSHQISSNKQTERQGSPSSEDSRPGSSLEIGLQQVKKRVSLADYKRRKAVVRRDSEQSTPSTPQPTSPSPPLSLPPLPLEVAGQARVALPSLPDLPGLENFNRERRSSPRHHSNSHQRDHKHSPARSGHRREKGRSSRNDGSHRGSSTPSPVLPAPPPPQQRIPLPPPIPPPDVPREDLTERLRKEFGLNVEDSDGEDSVEVEDRGGDARLSGLEGRLVSNDRQSNKEFKYGYSTSYRDSYSDNKSRDSYDGRSRDGLDISSKSRVDSYEKLQRDSDSRSRDSYDCSRDKGYSETSSRSRDIERKKVGGTPSGRAMSGLNTNQGQSGRRPRTPHGSPTRRSSVDQGFYGGGKEGNPRGDNRHRTNSYPSKNFYAS